LLICFLGNEAYVVIASRCLSEKNELHNSMHPRHEKQEKLCTAEMLQILSDFSHFSTLYLDFRKTLNTVQRPGYS